MIVQENKQTSALQYLLDRIKNTEIALLTIDAKFVTNQNRSRMVKFYVLMKLQILLFLQNLLGINSLDHCYEPLCCDLGKYCRVESLFPT